MRKRFFCLLAALLLLLPASLAEAPRARLTIGGYPIGDFAIVYSDSVYEPVAAFLQERLAEACGETLPLLPQEAWAESGKRLILVGMPETAEGISPCTGEDIFSLSAVKLRHAIEQRGGTLCLCGREAWTAYDAAAEFAGLFLDNAEGEIRVEDMSLQSEKTAALPLAEGAQRRIMTLNTYGSKGDFARVSALILRCLPDVVGLQEVNGVNYPQIVRPLRDVYAVSAQEHADGTLSRTPILYRKDRLREVESAVTYLDARYTGTKTKSIAYAVFEPLEGGERFAVINLHGALISDSYGIAGTNAVEGAAWREDNVRQMLSLLDSLRARYGDIPTLCTGDYNCNRTSTAYAAALAGGLKDAEFCALDSGTTGIKTTHPLGEKPPAGESIDHIFCTQGVTVVSHKIYTDPDAMKATDHCAVYADVVLKQ